MMKDVGSTAAPDPRNFEAMVEMVTQSTTPRRKQGSERVASCPPHCSHNASLPSDILVEIKVCLYHSKPIPAYKNWLGINLIY